MNTPRWITDDAGLRIWSWESDAFGTTIPNMDVDGDGIDFWFNMRFPGQYFDQESNMHYNYFRDYEPATGRYLESDPIGLWGDMNTFEYVNSSPIRYTDSSGLRRDPPGICDGLPAGFGGDCKNRFFPDPPSCKGDKCCKQTFSECYRKCRDFYNETFMSWATVETAKAGGIASYLIAKCGEKGEKFLKFFAKRVLGPIAILETSSIPGCALACTRDKCAF